MDDNIVVLTATIHLLRSAGYHVIEAVNCADCWRVLRTDRPDVVLLDVVLPDGNGVDLCHEIKTTTPFENTFVALLSSREISSEQQVSGLDAGADGYIARPIENRELVARVHSLVRIQQAESALRRTQDELEKRVEQRTAELARTNAALLEEVAERIQAEQTLRQYAERLRIQHGIDQAILAAHSATDIAEAALIRSGPLLQWTQACVVSLDEGHNRAQILCASRGDQKLIGGEWTLTPGRLAHLWTFQDGKPRVLINARSLFPLPEEMGAAEESWATMVDVPLLAEGKLIGLLQFFSDQSHAFSAEQIEFAVEMAAQLAVALQQARLFEQVTDSRERLRALSLRLVAVQEAERRFIARELHDEIGQVLTGLKLSLDLLNNKASPEWQPSLKDAVHSLNDLMNRVRQLSLDLRPQMLDDLGLLPALDWHFRRYTSQTGIAVDFKHRGLPPRLPGELETAVYRLIQEALTNVARYAQTKQATVRIWTDEVSLGVQIEDLGAGFELEKLAGGPPSNGLSGMRERAELLGGAFILESEPGQGTRITVDLPWPRTGQEQELQNTP